MTVLAFYGAGFGLGNSLFEESLQGTSSISSSHARTGTYSYRANPTTTGTGYFQFVGSSTGSGTAANFSAATTYAEFGFLYDTKSSNAAGEEICEIVDSANGLKLAIRLTSAGKLAVYDKNNALLATSPTVLTSGTWYHVGIKCGTGASAAWALVINGTADISGTGAALGTSNAAKLMLGKRTDRNGTTVDYFYDDVSIDDAGFHGPNTRVLALRPNGDTTTADWASGTGTAPFYSQVASSPASATDYIKNAATANKVSLFAFDRMDCGQVLAVKPSLMYRIDTNGDTATLKIRTVSGATTDDTTGVSVTSTLVLAAEKLYLTDPNTSAAWHYSDVNRLNVGAIETLGKSVRVTDIVLQVLYVESPTSLTIGALSLVAQESGVPAADNTYLNGTNESALSPGFSNPTAVNDTRKFGVFGQDNAFPWDMRIGGVEGVRCAVAYGDTFGEAWAPPFAGVSGATGSTTFFGANGTDLAAMTGSGTLALLSGVAFGNSPGWGYAERSDGRRLYFSYTGKTGGTTLTGVKFIVASSAGATTINGGDVIAHRQNWRSQTIGTTTTQDLSSGFVIDDYRPHDSSSSALEVVVSSHDTDASATTNQVFTGASSIACTVRTTSFLVTANTGAVPHGCKPGDAIIVTSTTHFNQEWLVRAVRGPFDLYLGGAILADFTESGNLRVSQFTKTADPTTSNETSKYLTGGTAIPGIGAGGMTRQLIFLASAAHYPTGAFGAQMAYGGIAYSDDDGSTWTFVSAAGKVSSSTSAVSSFTGSQTLVCTNITDLPAGAAVVEVDTDTGYALLSYGSRTSNTLNNVLLLHGTGNLLGASSGVRYAMWADDATWSSPHMQRYPWRHTDGYVYALTNRGGRMGAAHISRCPEASTLDLSAWQYWDGTQYQWDRTRAKPVFGTFDTTAPFGEPTFMYHTGVGQWVAAYLDQFNGGGFGRLVIRTAAAPEGPWSPPTQVFSNDNVTSPLYGSGIHPWSGRAPNPKNVLYINVACGDPYATFLAKVTMDYQVNYGDLLALL